MIETTSPYWFETNIKIGGFNYNVFRFIGFDIVVYHVVDKDQVVFCYQGKKQLIPYSFQEYIEMLGYEDEGNRDFQFLKEILLEQYEEWLSYDKSDLSYHHVTINADNFKKIFRHKTGTNILAETALIDQN